MNQSINQNNSEELVKENIIKRFFSRIYKIKVLAFHFTPLLVLSLAPDAKYGIGVWAWFVFLYFFKMFFITAGYHRYFSHKSYKLNRFFQFVFAFFAQTSAQKGALWWAANHRHHHKYSDEEEDFHSSKRYGFFQSHIGWIISKKHDATDWDRIKDFAKYKELVWLNKNKYIPFLMTGAIFFFVAGYFFHDNPLTWNASTAWVYLLISYVGSNLVVFHFTFFINSLMHSMGKPRYKTGEESKNSLFLAIMTMGEGWHNNHHYYQSSCSQGFFKGEIDLTYMILRLMSYVGIVKGIRQVPEDLKYSNFLDEKELLKLKKKSKINLATK